MSLDKKKQLKDLETEIDELSQKIAALEKQLYYKNDKLLALMRVVEFTNKQ